MRVRLRLPKATEHQLLVRWRNENEEFFFSDQPIMLADHIGWYTRVREDETQCFFVIEADALPVGTIGLQCIDRAHQRAEYGRFLIRPERRRQGIGSLAMCILLYWAFFDLQLQKVYGEILAGNRAAIDQVQGLGFGIEGYFRDHVFRDDEWRDVVRVSMRRYDFEQDRIYSDPLIRSGGRPEGPFAGLVDCGGTDAVLR